MQNRNVSLRAGHGKLLNFLIYWMQDRKISLRAARGKLKKAFRISRRLEFPQRASGKRLEFVFSVLGILEGRKAAQWCAVESPRFRTICSEIFIGIRKIGSAFLYFAILFFAEQNCISTKCIPLFSFPFYCSFLGGGFTKIASAFLFTVCIFNLVFTVYNH